MLGIAVWLYQKHLRRQEMEMFNLVHSILGVIAYTSTARHWLEVDVVLD